MDSVGKFMAASLPALAGASSHTPAARISHVDYRGSSISSGVAGVVPAVADGGFGQVRGPARDLAVESLRRSSPVEDAGTGSAKPGVVSLERVVCPIMGTFRSADQLVHGIETGVSRRSSDPDSLASMG